MQDSTGSRGMSQNSDEGNVSSGFRIPVHGWIAAGAFTAFIALGFALYVYLAVPSHVHAPVLGYLGPKACARCHEKQAASWSETRMAKSFDVLRPGQKMKEKELAGLDPNDDYTHNDMCVPCHTTGYGKEGGFISIEETPQMAGVTCEACHGAGGMYVDSLMDAKDPTFSVSEARKAGLSYPPTARVCRGCHNEDSPFVGENYEFNYDDRVKKGTHAHYTLKYKHE